jgi:hypothetical protein
MVNCMKNPAFRLLGLQSQRQLRGVLGYITVGKVRTTPFVGYAMAHNREEKLYIRLNAKIRADAERDGVLLHGSSGAASFKRNRGGIPHIEYHAVYCSHLSHARRLPWRALELVGTRIGIPLIQRYEL